MPSFSAPAGWLVGVRLAEVRSCPEVNMDHRVTNQPMDAPVPSPIRFDRAHPGPSISSYPWDTYLGIRSYPTCTNICPKHRHRPVPRYAHACEHGRYYLHIAYPSILHGTLILDTYAYLREFYLSSHTFFCPFFS